MLETFGVTGSDTCAGETNVVGVIAGAFTTRFVELSSTYRGCFMSAVNYKQFHNVNGEMLGPVFFPDFELSPPLPPYSY